MPEGSASDPPAAGSEWVAWQTSCSSLWFEEARPARQLARLADPTNASCDGRWTSHPPAGGCLAGPDTTHQRVFLSRCLHLACAAGGWRIHPDKFIYKMKRGYRSLPVGDLFQAQSTIRQPNGSSAGCGSEKTGWWVGERPASDPPAAGLGTRRAAGMSVAASVNAMSAPVTGLRAGDEHRPLSRVRKVYGRQPSRLSRAGLIALAASLPPPAPARPRRRLAAPARTQAPVRGQTRWAKRGKKGKIALSSAPSLFRSVL